MKNNWLKKGLAVYFSLGLLGMGTLAEAGIEREKRDRAEINDVARNAGESQELPEAVVDPAAGESFEQAIAQGISCAQLPGDENGQKAQEFFAQAVKLDIGKATSFETDGLDPNTVKLYTNALRTEQLNRALGKGESGKKEKKSNALLYILGALAVAGGVYALTSKKKSDDNNNNDNKTTLEFDVYNHTKGLLKHYTLKDVTYGTSVTISISDLGVSGVDANRIAVRGPLTNCEYVAFDRDGAVTFTVNKAKNQAYNSKYTIFLMNDTGKYDLIDEWIDKGGGSLEFSPNCTYRREDSGGKTGPQSAIDDAINQLNNALSKTGIQFGSINKVDSGGDIKIGYSYTTALGGHTSDYAFINPDHCASYVKKVSLLLEEIFEILTETADLGGPSTWQTIIQDSNYETGKLNQAGEDLFAYVYVKDTQKIGAGSSTTASVMSAINALGALDAKIRTGDFEMGLADGGLKAGLARKNLNISTTMRVGSFGFENMTSASVNIGNRMDAGFTTIHSRNQQAYSANVGVKVRPDTNVGVRAIYDAKTRAGSLGLSVGKEFGRSRVDFSFGRNTLGQANSSMLTANGLFDVGGNRFQVTGSYQDNRSMVASRSLSIGVNADLDKLVKSMSLNAYYSDTMSGSFRMSYATLGVARQIGPGRFMIGIAGRNGSFGQYELSYTLSRAF